MVRPKLLCVAGEASADRCAARVVVQLRQRAGDLEVRGLGGPALAHAGMRLDADLRRTTAMGGVELARRLPRIVAAWSRLIAIAARWRPDAALLVDLPDFNLPLGRRLRGLGVPVLGYVAPQFWAWRPGRVATLSRCVDQMACILPFELGPLLAAGIDATFVGHPLLDEPPVDRERVRSQVLDDPASICLALLPGSRPAELERHLGPMLEAASIVHERRAVEVVLSVAPSIGEIGGTPGWVRRIDSDNWTQPGAAALAAADAALVASGTATLEAALAGVPQIAVCRLAFSSYLVARAAVRSRFFALPNLVLGRRAIPELLQGQADAGSLSDHVLALLERPELASSQRRVASELTERLAGPGAARTTADLLEGLMAR